MKIIPPAGDIDPYLWKVRKANELQRMDGGHWRVDVIHGRYGWYARAVPMPSRPKGRKRRAPAGSGSR